MDVAPPSPRDTPAPATIFKSHCARRRTRARNQAATGGGRLKEGGCSGWLPWEAGRCLAQWMKHASLLVAADVTEACKLNCSSLGKEAMRRDANCIAKRVSTQAGTVATCR
eukprot:992195-Pleurochrysis_carterae.AAC.1